MLWQVAVEVASQTCTIVHTQQHASTSTSPNGSSISPDLTVTTGGWLYACRWRYFLAPHIIRSTDQKLSDWEVAVLVWVSA